MDRIEFRVTFFHTCDLWEVSEAETMDLRALVCGAGWPTRETLTHRNHCEQSLGRCHIPELGTALTLPSGCWTDWRNLGWNIMWLTWSMKFELELCRILTWEKRKIRDQILKSVLYSKPAGSIYYIGLWSSSADRDITSQMLKDKLTFFLIPVENTQLNIFLICSMKNAF